MTRTRHIGGSLLPSNDRQVLMPLGSLCVRVLAAEDTHGLYDGDEPLAKHPNGYSCYELAKRIRSGRCAREQAEYIVACGGTITQAGQLRLL